jgi:hypothetical protein
MSPARSLAVCLVALFVAACGVVSTTPPSPTPADFPGIAIELAKRGLIVSDVIAGDAGCDDHVLAPTAISFLASGLDQPTPVRIRLYIFRNRATFDRLQGTVDNCARSFVTDPATYESVAESPFLLAGQGPWGATFEAKVREGLEVAAGTGN